MDRSTAEGAASDLSAAIGALKRGSLRVFGDWFGRPMDNVHVACSAWADGEDLVVRFDGDEELRITRPADWEFSQEVLQVGHADRVVWRWYDYGRPKLPENLYTIEHWVDADGTVRARSDETWYTPTFEPLSDLPAAELL